MPLPDPLVGLTVRAKIIDADSTPVAGVTITLTPTVTAQSPSGDVLLTATALSRTTAADGSAEWTNVLATDSPGLSNRVPYRVTITSGSTTLVAPYVVELLSSLAVGGVLRLDDIAPATPPPPLASYVLAASVGAVGGPAGPLDAGGKVPAAQLPVGGGSVPATRLVAATNGLQGGGDLTADRTLSPVYGSTSGTVCQGNDSRLSDARTPLAHSHAQADVTGLVTALAGKAPVAHGHILERIAQAFGGATINAHPFDFIGTATPVGNDHLIALVPVNPGETITAVKVVNGAAATYSATGVPAQARAFDFDGALLGTSPDDPALWGTVGTRTCNFSGSFVAPSNGLIYVGVSFGGFTGISLPSANSGFPNSVNAGLAGGKRMGIFANSVSGIPASFAPASYGFATSWIPVIVVVSSP